MLRGVDYSFGLHASKVSIILCYAMGWVGLSVNLSGLGWAGFKKMDLRPTLLTTAWSKVWRPNRCATRKVIVLEDQLTRSCPRPHTSSPCPCPRGVRPWYQHWVPLTWPVKSRTSSSNDVEEQTWTWADDELYGTVDVANSHLSRIRASSGNIGWLYISTVEISNTQYTPPTELNWAG